jgi:N-acetyl-anhydromuramyl-L-alanine amidase AmpD
MMEIIKYGDFKPLGKQKKKSQIILTHTSRNVENYLASLRYRYNGKFDRIPNYVITKEGKILQLLDNIEHTNYFNEPNINRNGIIISLENLGWLEKQPLEDHHINWIGDIYKGKPFERKWRDYFFWEPYSEEQIKSLVNLVKNLFKVMKIQNNVIGHNTKIKGIEKFEGLVTRSNFNSDYTDMSPAFDFEKIINNLTNE